MSARNAFLYALPLAAAAIVLAAGGATAQQPEKGERLVNVSCTGCHNVRTIQTSAKNHEEWNQTVQDMLQKGADVGDADIPVLVDYLAQNYGPIPEGPGKDIVLNTCTMCHDLKRIKFGRRSSEEWEETLNSMLNEGAPLSERDFPIVHQYLSRNFGNE
jgi:cytochrome c5